MLSFISMIVVLGVLIFVHELGHFLFAKLFGVGVEKFSLGFGKKLVGRKIGETEYLISAFPLGGYVKMVGESPEAEVEEADQSRSFIAKPPLQRIVIVVAGPLFNLLFACLVFIMVYMLGVPSPTSRIGDVMKDKPAARVGILKGDLIVEINGEKVTRWEHVSKSIGGSGGKPINLTVKRGEKLFAFRVTPEVTKATNIFGEAVTKPVIGISSSEEVVTDHYGPIAAIGKGSAYTWEMIKLTLVAFQKILMRAISLDNLGGPIMIAVESGKQAAAGPLSLVLFMAVLSVNLGVLNLLPVPILDGGHLVFYIWELLFRKPVSTRVREIGQQIGLVFLVSLMLLATYNDLVRYWEDIVKFLGRIFNLQ